MLGLPPRSPRRRPPTYRPALAPVAALVEALEARRLMATGVTNVGVSASYTGAAGFHHDFFIDSTVTPAPDANNVIEAAPNATSITITLTGRILGPPGIDFPPNASHSNPQVRPDQFPNYTCTFGTADNSAVNTAAGTGQSVIPFTLVIRDVPVGVSSITYQVSPDGLFTPGGDDASVPDGTSVVDIRNQPGIVNTNLQYSAPRNVAFNGNLNNDPANPGVANLTGAGLTTTELTGPPGLTVNPNGTFTYTPPLSAPIGSSVSFTYQLTALGVTTTTRGKATLTVVDQAPIIPPQQPLIVNKNDTEKPIALVTTDPSDPDSQLTITVHSVPVNGTLVLLSSDAPNATRTPIGVGGQFTQQNVDDGLVLYVPKNPGNPPAVASDPFTFSVSNGPFTTPPGANPTYPSYPIQYGNGVNTPVITGLSVHKPQDMTFTTPPVTISDPNPSLVGDNAPAGSTVNVYVSGGSATPIATTTATPTGGWAATLSLADGSDSFYVEAVDNGQTSFQSAPFGPVTVDTKAPQLSTPTVSPASPAGPGNWITATAMPTVQVQTSDEAGIPVTVTVSRGGTVLGTSAPVTGGGTASVILKQNGGLNAGTNALTVTATNAAGGTSSVPLTVALDTVSPVVGTPQLAATDLLPGTGPSSPATPTPATSSASPTVQFLVQDQAFSGVTNSVTVTYYLDSMSAEALSKMQSIAPGINPAFPVVNANSAFSVTLANVAVGTHTLHITATDAAGNTSQMASFVFEKVGQPGAPTPGAAGTPVYTTVFDLSKLGIPGVTPSVFPWTESFDPTTETLWLDLRGGDVKSGNTGAGNSVMQFDPSTGNYKIYSLNAAAKTPAEAALLDESGPHGIFFDFESHITPRVWFTSLQKGLFSYLDLTNPSDVTLNSYNVTQFIKQAGLLSPTGMGMAGPHAVFVDEEGHVWVSDHDDSTILEFIADPSGQSNTLQVIAHPEPTQVTNPKGDNDGSIPIPSGPHGIDVTIDASSPTGQPYVWFTQLKAGNVVLLEPGAGPNGTDIWKNYPISTTGGTPLFTAIDTLETPDQPQDDRIYFSDPGFSAGPAGGDGLIYALDPKTNQLSTYMVPKPPGGTSTPQINTVFLDRDGNLYYIDRQYGVGRLDPINAASTTRTVTPTIIAPPKTTIKTGTLAPFDVYSYGNTVQHGTVPTTTVLLGPGVTGQPTSSGFTSVNVSQETGLNQYSVLGPVKASPLNNQNRGGGPFRGALNASNDLFGSLTQNDEISESVFADTAQRPMAAVVTPNGTRYAFQTFRDGSVTPALVRMVVTTSAPGQLISRQGDLPTAAPLPALVGDPTAVVDAKGVVHAFVRNAAGGLSEFTQNTTGGWSVTLLPAPSAAAGILAADPRAFLDTARGPGVAVTTSAGHLLVYYPSVRPAPFDLTPTAAETTPGISLVMYSTPGVVESQGRIYVDATDQAGRLLELSYPVAGPVPSGVTPTVVPIGPNKALQDVTEVAVGNVRHIFVTDGGSELIHVAAVAAGGTNRYAVENITQEVEAAGTAIGYTPYEQPYAARTYSGISATVDPTTGRIYVYGTNGRDLIQFAQVPGNKWQVTDLTNDVSGTPNTIDTANRVFGAPSAYVDPDGARHIFQINAFGEVIEYYQLTPGAPLSTVDITLINGNTSATSPQSFNPANPAPVVTPPILTTAARVTPRPSVVRSPKKPKRS